MTVEWIKEEGNVGAWRHFGPPGTIVPRMSVCPPGFVRATDGRCVYPPLPMTPGVKGLEWLGVPKDAAACTAYKNALVNVTNSLKNLQDDLAALDAARIQAAQNGQDTSQLDAQRSNILSAISAAQAQINDLNSKIADACQEVTPGPGMNTTCATDGDCTSDYECVNGNCLPRCPPGQVRGSDGTCAASAPTTSTSSGAWGLALLAGGAAAAIFFGLKPPAMTAADKAHAQRYKENPRRRRRRAA